MEIIGAAPVGGVNLNAVKARLLVTVFGGLVAFLLAVVNAYIFTRITTPIQRLGEVEPKSGVEGKEGKSGCSPNNKKKKKK